VIHFGPQSRSRYPNGFKLRQNLLRLFVYHHHPRQLCIGIRHSHANIININIINDCNNDVDNINMNGKPWGLFLLDLLITYIYIATTFRHRAMSKRTRWRATTSPPHTTGIRARDEHREVNTGGGGGLETCLEPEVLVFLSSRTLVHFFLSLYLFY
jgi:hypothetical protein